ncbi:hypothetical protein VNO78_11864 [Psophocarpus tetragonolobus]|uniref:Uncharacterized protein n=1 Tax=Psophocarpus tetragonolobus TaxID=3891 RepID=A0AAN9SPU4_PSOTE
MGPARMSSVLRCGPPFGSGELSSNFVGQALGAVEADGSLQYPVWRRIRSLWLWGHTHHHSPHVGIMVTYRPSAMLCTVVVVA